jgi:phospholipase/carboxylesterase
MTTENLQTNRELTARIKLYYDLFIPENARENAPLLIALHGYGAHKRQMMREARAVAPENFVIAALQGFHQHWREQPEKDAQPKIGFGWLTSFKPEDSVRVHHQALHDLIKTLTSEGVADKNKIFLLGFSQTCALNFRFAFSNPEISRGVVGISGGIPGDWETNENYQQSDAEIFYLYGTRDEFYPLETFEQNAQKLKLRARNYQSKVYDSAHEITDEMRAEISRWLQENEK